MRPCRRWLLVAGFLGRWRASARSSAGCSSRRPRAAHGPVPVEPPTAASLLLGWTFEPLPTLGLVAAVVWWLWAVRRVDRAHPANPVPRRRTVAFLAGITALAFALLSGIGRYDTTLFSVHMVQHVLLMLVAAPLLALAAPITLILRAQLIGDTPPLGPAGAPFAGRAVPGPPGHGLGDVRGDDVGGPLLAAVQRVARGPVIHDLEHVLFLTGALFFWWPAVALDPCPTG